MDSMATQPNDEESERDELVLAEMEQLSKHLEAVGIDKVKAGLGEVLEAMFVVARTHPDESMRVLYGAALTQLWTSASVCRDMLERMADQTDTSRLH